MSRRLSLPKNAHPFQLLEHPEMKLLYDHIISSKPPIHYANIARELDESILFVKRRVRIMNSYGYRFRVTINEKLIGLSTLHVFLKTTYIPDTTNHVKGLSEKLKWLLRWMGNLIFPVNQGVLMFYVPLRDEVISELTNELYQVLPVEMVYETDVTIGNKPSLEYLKRREGVVPYSTDWEKLARDIMDAYRSGVTPSHYKEALKTFEIVSLDLLDILIISIYQIDALLTLQEVSKKLKKPVPKLRRHLNSHLLNTGVITGIRLKDYVGGSRNTMYLLVFGRSEPYDVALFMEYIRRTFNFLSGAYNSLTGEYSFVLALPGPDYLYFTKYMAEPYINLLNGPSGFTLDTDSIRSYSLPFLAFSREEKFWDADINVIQLMKEKLQDILAHGGGGG